jgi:hypothetical protein
MKYRRLFSILIAGLFAGLALLAGSAAQGQNPQPPRYTVRELAKLPGETSSYPQFITTNRLVSGGATLAGGTQHAVLWRNKRITESARPDWEDLTVLDTGSTK